MTISVNGRTIDHIEGESVSRLLKRMRFLFPMVVVKVDGVIVPDDRFTETMLHDGAVVEIIHLTSGG
ncbi:MAG: sulfur carrier protein ThiS [Candidatus Thermoplasmatota archaeon]|nr:sulfur carrier protein ThiS [Candidatus Thermoplasmatota archaeon]